MSSRATDIAICGASCRLPGDVASPEDLWKLLVAGKDAITEIPDTRWVKSELYYPHREGAVESGTSYVFSAGVIEDIEHFDASFFGISPREAEQMDPQQRLLLELAWESLESAGIPPSQVAGSQTGVFVGVSLNDYSGARLGDGGTIDSYYMTGTALSIVSNRVSYLLDLHGPSFSVDTACSSSLVALHLACQSLRSGEVPRALVGGVNALLTPYAFMGFSSASMLSPEGRCRTFDADAKGYVRAEGGVVFVLEPLEAALASRRNILGVIRNTGVNSDGRTRGIALPNPRAQEGLLRSVYGAAGVDASEVRYLEAHGTGTPVGDPMELDAIGGFFAEHRSPEDPLLIGSVKSNIGHLESGAGLAGTLKVLLATQHRAVPPSLHFERPNPEIAFDRLGVKVVTDLTPLPGDEPLVMGVNSFGFGGTNAHVVIESAPRGAAAEAPLELPEALPSLRLSARAMESLRVTAGRFADRLDGVSPAEYYRVAYSARHHRDLHAQRLQVQGKSVAEVCERLRRFSRGELAPGVASNTALPPGSRVAFMYSGNGSQWQGMGVELLASSETFARAVTAVDSQFARNAGWSILEELRRPHDQSRLAATEIAQPCLFAVQVGLTSMLRAWGLTPDFVFGHSVGEIAAAHASGALSLEHAAAIIHKRSLSQARTRGLGRMAAVGISAARAREEIQAFGGEVELACMNSPQSVTLAGPFAHLEALRARLEPTGIFFRILDLDYAFHSRVLDPYRDELLGALPESLAGPTTIPFVSSIVGGEAAGSHLDAEYWWDNLRKPVQFGAALDHLVEQGVRLFVEVGPHPILAGYVRDAGRAHSARLESLSLMDRRTPSAELISQARAQLTLLTDALDLRGEFPTATDYLPIPTYAWQRQRYAYDPSPDATLEIRKQPEHPLLGTRERRGQATWEARIDTRLQPYLADHRVGEHPVFPGSAFVEMALAAGGLHAWNGAPPRAAGQCVEDLQILSPLRFDADEVHRVRLAASVDDGRFSIESRTRLSKGAWTLHATGRLVGGVSEDGPTRLEVPRRDQGPVFTGAEHYADAADVGLNFGPAFQGVEAVRIEGREAWGWLRSPAEMGLDTEGYLVHPSLLDSAFQVLLKLAQQHTPGDEAYVPIQFGRILRVAPGVPALSHVHLRRIGTRTLMVDYRLLAEDGTVLVEIDQCRLQAVDVGPDEDRPVPLLEFQLRPRQRYGEGYQAPTPAPARIHKVIQEALAQEAVRAGRAAYHDGAAPLVEAAVASVCHQALRELGAPRRPLPLAQWIPSMGILPSQARFLEAMLPLLETAGAARHGPEGWQLMDELDLPPLEEIWRSLVATFPAYAAQWTLLGRVGLHLPRLLRGALRLEEIMPATPGEGLRDHLQEASPPAVLLHRGLMAGLEEIARSWPADRRLRVLEFGARGATRAAELRERFPDLAFEYLLVTEDEHALSELEMEAATVPGARARCLGSTEYPRMGEHEHDVIVAPDSLHQVDSLERTLDALRAALAPGGMLLAGELPPDRWYDLVFGLDPSWWARSQEQVYSRRAGPRSWVRALEHRGFDDVQLAREPVTAEAVGAFLVTARRPLEDAPPGFAESGAPLAGRRWLLLADRAGASHELAESLGRELVNHGADVIRIQPGTEYSRPSAGVFRVRPDRPEDFSRLLADLGPPRGDEGVLHLMGLELREEPPAEDMLELQTRRLSSLMHLLQACSRSEQRGPDRLVLVTGNAHPPPPEAKAVASRTILPSQSPLLGFGRVLANEYRDRQLQMIDLRGPDVGPLLAGLVREVVDPDGEDEVVLTPGARWVPRLVHRPGADGEVAVAPPGERPPGGHPETTLVVQGRGLGQLAWVPTVRRAPAEDEIEIEPRAVGLNFRDVMWAMGLLPEEALENGFAGPTLGLECAGVVTRVGAQVTSLRPGDEVVAYGPACFSSHVLTKAHAAQRKPASVSFNEAATLAGAFFTAYYSLEHLARLQPGERVLIHGGAGGVGLAAIQYAALKGCEIIATAGSDEKRDFLRLLGVDHVLNSRSLAFARDIEEITAGEGVDVILNSLAGEAINRNLSILKPFGRFVELGKRDYFANTRIGLKPLRNNVSYFGVDADQLFSGQPKLAERLFGEVLAFFDEGTLRPLAHRVFPRREVVDAFRYLQQSRHIGKVVLSMAEAPRARSTPAAAPPAVTAPAGPRIHPDATYLVVGGTGGFGLETARWLAAQGAHHLALLSRRGITSKEGQAAVDDLEAAGCRVHVVEADVTDRESLARALEQLAAAAPPLRGVVHSAMVLEDSIVENLDHESLMRVLAPKLLGARHLDELTRDCPLDLFVTYSSATTVFGNPGQANYVAANIYLEALAAQRRSRGAPALAIGWGAITDAGVLTRHAEVREHLRDRVGDAGLTAAEALRTLGRVLATDAVAVAATRLDWGRIDSLLNLAHSPKFAALVQLSRGNGSAGEHGPSFLATIEELDVDERRLAVLELVRKRIAEILQWPQDRIDVDAPTLDIGLDSLMAVELRAALERDLALSLTPALLSQGTTIRGLAKTLSDRVEGDRTSTDGEVEAVSFMLRRHGAEVAQKDIEDIAAQVGDAGPLTGS